MKVNLIYEGWLDDHLHYRAAYDRLVAEIELVLNGGPAIVAPVLGLSGTGKTELLKDIAERLADRLTSKGRPAVLVVSFPPGATAEAVAERIIKCILGIRTVKGTGYQLRERARELLAGSGTLVLILDEANHAAEARSTRSTQTKTNRLTADWIKEIVDVAMVSVVFSGLPHSRRLLTDNEQLEGRALRPIELNPYAWHIAEDRHAFHELVYAFAGHARASGWAIDMSNDMLVRATYMTGRGLVRPVRRLFERAVVLASASRVITNSVFATAFDHCFQESVSGNPFTLEKITDEMLNAAHRQMLQSAHEPQRRGRDRSEGRDG